MLPKFQNFFKMILEVLSDGEVKKKSVISEEIAKNYNISEEDIKELTRSNSGLTKFQDRISWALVYLLKAEMITRPQSAFYKITEKGKELLKTEKGPIDNYTLGQYSEQFAQYQYMRTGKKVQKKRKSTN